MRYLKLKNIVLLIAINLLGVGLVHAQQVVVMATIDSTAIQIGEQTMIRLEVAGDKDKLLQLPIYSSLDTIITGIEVLEMFKPDTTDLGNNRIKINQNYMVTSFDSALYLIPPFKVICERDTNYSNTLGLKVSSMEVDTESGAFIPIKDVVNPKFVLTDFLPNKWYLWLGLIVIIVISTLLLLVYSEKTRIQFKKEEPALPPHIKAINGLNAVKIEKYWQQGRVKEYHSIMTDILRVYIEERFKTSAMEMTSGEILASIRRISETDSVFENLKQILQLADFVKFAKYQPLPDENELSLINSYLFVNQTKEEEKLVIPEENEENEKNEVNEKMK